MNVVVFMNHQSLWLEKKLLHEIVPVVLKSVKLLAKNIFKKVFTKNLSSI